MSISVPVWGAGGDASGSASYTRQNTTDHFASTEQQLSGFYAGRKGLGVDVAGPTTLTAGVLSSAADASLNHFNTGSLSATGVSNVSGWQATQTGFSFSSGAGMGSTAGILGSIGTGLAAGASGMVGAGRAQQERSESVSAISGSIAVHAGSRSGSYTTDVSAADKALVNQFDAQKLSNQLQGQQIGSQLVGEVGGKVSDALSKESPLFNEGGLGRLALETGGNMLVAAVTGGNVGSAGAGTAAGGLASAIALPAIIEVSLQNTGGDVKAATTEANALAALVASASSALGGIAAGGGSTSVNALNGAGYAATIAQYNMSHTMAALVNVAKAAGGSLVKTGNPYNEVVGSVLLGGAEAYILYDALVSQTSPGQGTVVHSESGEGNKSGGSVGNGNNSTTSASGGAATPEPEGEGAEKNNRPSNLSPEGAGRSGAFKQAKRDSGIPVSKDPDRVVDNVDRKGNKQPGKIYEYDMPAPGGGKITIKIRDDANGHVYKDDPAQNRGPHFNTPDGEHYDYQK